jgi:hypothetical protein
MPKTVFRTKITMVKEDISKSFFESLPGIESTKAEWKTSGKIYNYYGENSEDGNTRVFICDFLNEDTKNEFRTLSTVDEGMRALYIHNSNNNIITYFEETNLETSDYD